MAKTISLKVTSAFLVAGKIAKVGDVVEVDEVDAKSLLHRGKATLAVAQEQDGPLTDEGTAGETTEAAEQTTEAAEPATEAAEAAPKAKKGKK